VSYLAKALAVRLEWDEAAAASAFAATLYRLRDVTGTTGDQRATDLWDALNIAWFAENRPGFDAALAELENHTLSTWRARAPAPTEHHIPDQLPLADALHHPPCPGCGSTRAAMLRAGDPTARCARCQPTTSRSRSGGNPSGAAS
jgi:hypothetical protein